MRIHVFCAEWWRFFTNPPTGVPPLIAILYVATGRYITFWDEFFTSSERFLLPGLNKRYFIFTDKVSDIVGEDTRRVTKINQKRLGWPYDTLMRYDLFLSIEKSLKNFDYIFFFNANTLFLRAINAKDLLPVGPGINLVFALQPHMFHLPRDRFTYERNPRSSAYIPFGQGNYYLMGGLNGGRSNAYLDMCRVIAKNTREDLNNNIVATWHDESHLNKYALGRRDVKVLDPYFSRGEYEYWKRTAKLMFSDKSHYRFGGHAFLRGLTDVPISKSEWEIQNGRRKKHYRLRIKQYIKALFIRTRLFKNNQAITSTTIASAVFLPNHNEHKENN